MDSSKFFAASSSESESESSGDEDFVTQPQSRGVQKGFVWSDDEEDTKRVVRSEKEKRWDDLKSIIKNMKNHKKIKDMQSIQTDFEELTRAYDKSRKVVQKEGVPRFFTRCLVELDDFINQCWEDREWRKTLSKGNAKGLASQRQKLRKYVRDSNFDNELAKYRENPDEEGAEESEKEEESEDDEEELDFKKSAPAAKPAKPAPKSDDEIDSDYWPPSDSETSSSEDEAPGTLTRDYFLRAAPGEEKEKKVKEKKVREAKKTVRQIEDDDDEGFTVIGSAKVTEKPKIFPKDTEITIEVVIKKLNELITNRGKKGTDRLQMIDWYIELRNIAKEHNLGVALDVKLLFAVVGAVFDYNPNIATCMKSEMWERSMGYVEELLDLLETHKDTVTIGSFMNEDSEDFEGEGPFKVRGSIVNVVERLDEEYIKMLQACDAHSTEYVDRLRDEPKMCKIIEDLQKYLEERSTPEEKCRVYLKRIEHIYYKFDAKVDSESLPMMENLSKYIYEKDDTDRVRTRTMLCHIYHLALHDKWYQARDLMLMSHLQDNIHNADIPTQIMYNRAMVQLGLCAFRQGMTKDAHNCLVDIQSSGRAKELLAQGLLLQRQHERSPEQEKIEKRRQMPFHMHINLELIECVYLVSAMLMEIPYMAAHEFDARRRMISKNFHHVLRVSDRQPLLGPPESMREHLVAASKAMKTGHWKKCHNFIINEKMNTKVWDLFQDSEKVKEQLVEKIKVESLRTYLFSYSQVYDSMSLDSLAAMYELPRARVNSTISKMIINEELAASMDEPSSCVIMHRTDPSQLQALALQLSEKVQALVDHNEKLMEMKSGNFFQRSNYQNRDGQQNYQQSNRYQNRYQGNKDGGQGRYQGNKDGGQGRYQGNKDGGQGRYQGNKDGGQGRYQGGKDNQQNRYNKQGGNYQNNRYQDRRVHFE